MSSKNVMDSLSNLELFNKLVEESKDERTRWKYNKANCFREERFYYLGNIIGRDLMLYFYDAYLSLNKK
jgi:hypothetical protein